MEGLNAQIARGWMDYIRATPAQAEVDPNKQVEDDRVKAANGWMATARDPAPPQHTEAELEAIRQVREYQAKQA